MDFSSDMFKLILQSAEKLSQENENFRAENRDYKLLRKVFGHKQIDDLLEKARNIKGQKRENPRSR
ncbi:hypothetical protein ACQRBK_08450 [Peptoniphilaceae bacterium SGI.137]